MVDIGTIYNATTHFQLFANRQKIYLLQQKHILEFVRYFLIITILLSIC